MEEALNNLLKLAIENQESLTHFLVPTETQLDHERGHHRLAKAPIEAETVIAIIGGLLTSSADNHFAMPLGFGLFLHQIREDRRAMVNHSCAPNCRIDGLNRLTAHRPIAVGEELTIDYGSISVGRGQVIIENCFCQSQNCRGRILTSDYLIVDEHLLGLYARSRRKWDEHASDSGHSGRYTRD